MLDATETSSMDIAHECGHGSPKGRDDHFREHSAAAPQTHPLGDVHEVLDRLRQDRRLDAIFASKIPPEAESPPDLVEGLLTEGGSCTLFGPPNSGKTFFALDIGCAVALGVPWMTRNTTQGVVVYLATESPASVRTRVQAYKKAHCVDLDDLLIVQSPIHLFPGDGDAFELISLIYDIEIYTGKKVRLVIGDTLARMSAGANENSGQDMGKVLQHIDQIREACRCHFLLIHHSGKNQSAGARGWSGIRAAVDTEIEITSTPQLRYAEVTKQRDLTSFGERIGFTLAPITIGVSPWGKEQTSCVVVAGAAPARQPSKRTNRVGVAIAEHLQASGGSATKTDVASALASRFDRSGVYREMAAMVDAGLLLLEDKAIRLPPVRSE